MPPTLLGVVVTQDEAAKGIESKSANEIESKNANGIESKSAIEIESKSANGIESKSERHETKNKPPAEDAEKKEKKHKNRPRGMFTVAVCKCNRTHTNLKFATVISQKIAKGLS